MAIKEIEQNTDYLADDISRLEQEKTILEQAIDEMFAAVRYSWSLAEVEKGR